MIYGALLLVSGPRSSEISTSKVTDILGFSGPGYPDVVRNQEEEYDDYVDDFLEIINSLILGSLGILDLIDRVSSAQELFDRTEDLLREKNILRKEIIVLSDLQCQSQTKCQKIEEDYLLLKECKYFIRNMLQFSPSLDFFFYFYFYFYFYFFFFFFFFFYFFFFSFLFEIFDICC